MNILNKLRSTRVTKKAIVITLAMLFFLFGESHLSITGTNTDFHLDFRGLLTHYI